MNHIESVRWGDKPECPHCKSRNITRKNEKGMIGRWRCRRCNSSFNVLSGTFLEGTRIPLRRWFLAMALAGAHFSDNVVAMLLGLSRKRARYIMSKVYTELNDLTSLAQKL